MSNQEQYELICWKAENYDKMKKIIKNIIERIKEEKWKKDKMKQFVISTGITIALNIICDEVATQLTDIDIPNKEE